jgi:hypothetical protein
MHKSTKKLIAFTLLISCMVAYIGWVFYLSEPTYINHSYKKLEPYDYVSIPSSYNYYYDSDGIQDVINGIVLQIDSNKAIIKSKSYWGTDLIELDLKIHNFRIIGRGTLYHKVNNYVGFNVMFITQIFIGILCVVLMITLISILRETLS